MSDYFLPPDLYHAVHGSKDDDISFIMEWVKRVGGPVLELGAGTGRLAVPIVEDGFSYTGLDLDPAYVSWAGNKLSRYGPRCRMVVGDMRDFDLGSRFEFILVGFNTFLHLLSDEEAVNSLRCVRNHLTESGRFLLDLFVPDPETFLYRDKTKFYDVKEFDHPSRGHVTLREKNRYDQETEVNHIWWFFYTEGSAEPDTYEFDSRIVYPHTMDLLLMEAQLIIEEKFGDYDRSPLSESSKRQIYVCKR